MHSEHVCVCLCVGEGGQVGDGGHLKAIGHVCLPQKTCAFTSPLVHQPSSHPSISSSQSCFGPVTRHRPHVSFIPPRLLLCCFSVLCLSLFVFVCCCIPVFKKSSSSFLLQRFGQCVCLSLSVWPSSWQSGCRWKSEATQWATSPGGFLIGEVQPTHPHPPSATVTSQVMHRCLSSPSTFCLCVSPYAINLFSLPSCEVVISEVGEAFTFSLPSIF